MSETVERTPRDAAAQAIGEAGAPAVRSDARAHGGDVAAIARAFGVPVDDLVDFSASINPAGPPPRVLARLAREAADPRILARYPDPDYAELRTALARHLRVAPASIVIANGSAALFTAIARAFAPATCLLPVPAFGEQPRALTAAGCAIEPFRLHASDGFLPDVDALIGALGQTIGARTPSLCLLTNPHNPSGALVSASALTRIVRAAAQASTRLVVDEAFIDYAPVDSLAEQAARLPHLIVVRSLTKFYGMPALRVGYAVSTPDAAECVGAQLPPWAVTTSAAGAAAEALADETYARNTLATVAVERAWLRDGLIATGVDVFPSAANFLLIRLADDHPAAAHVRVRLIREHHLIVRDCRSFDGLEDGRFLRVAVRTREDNHRLLHALRAILRGD